MQVLVGDYDGSLPQFVVPLCSHYPLCAIGMSKLCGTHSSLGIMYLINSSVVLGA